MIGVYSREKYDNNGVRSSRGRGSERAENPEGIIEPSNMLIWLKVDPQIQAFRIKTRAREDWEREMQYAEPEWHARVENAYNKYPCPYINKYIIEVKS